MSEVIRAGIESIAKGQIEAAHSLGMTPGQTMRRIILPQTLRLIIPPFGNAVNSMFKTTSLLAFIGVPELFQVANAIQAATYRTFEVYLAVAAYYLILTGVWSVFQEFLERWLAKRH
jgi:polar amino acid transport system permease protein